MQVTETLNEGLKRKLAMTIPAQDLVSRLDAKLDDLKDKVALKGFRPGKVPVTHLKRVFGRSAMSEVMQDAINESVTSTLEQRSERAAVQPTVDLPEDQGTINQVLEGQADLNFDVSYEILPKFELMDFKGVKLERPVVEVTDENVEAEVKRFYLNNRGYEDKGEDQPIAEGDQVGLSFDGKIDGEPFEGGQSDHAHVIVGSGEFIPGFEEQLVGLKKGDTKEVSVTFPENYVNEELSGKAAIFTVTILHVGAPVAGELDDEFAKRFGLDNLGALREAIRTQMNQALAGMARQHMKRQVLDALDEGHKFDVPEQLVEAEFEAIWQRVMHEIEHHGRSFEDEGTTEDEARADYRRIAERRVRLGLVVAEIGNQKEIEVSDEEHQQALIAEVRRFPGQEQQVYDYYRKNPGALASLRAPIFEDKVVDFIIELADVSEKTMSREDLSRLIASDEDDESAHPHDHAHEHAHEHEHDEEGHAHG